MENIERKIIEKVKELKKSQMNAIKWLKKSEMASEETAKAIRKSEILLRELEALKKKEVK